MSNNPIYAFFATPKSFGPFLLRMLLAGVFLLHGGQKAFAWFGGPGWTATLTAWSDPEGMNLSAGLAVAAIVGELLIVPAMFFGFLTRLAALGVIGLMIGAMVLVHAGQGLAANEYPIALLTVGMALVFLGGGRLSMDRAISQQLLPVFG